MFHAFLFCYCYEDSCCSMESQKTGMAKIIFPSSAGAQGIGQKVDPKCLPCQLPEENFEHIHYKSRHICLK